MVGDFNNILGEDVMLPCAGGVLHHGDDGLVEVVVLRVQEDCLGPHLVSLTFLSQLLDLDLLAIGSDVVHQSAWLVLSIHDTQFSVNALMGPFQTHPLFQQLYQFFMVSEPLIVLYQIL